MDWPSSAMMTEQARASVAAVNPYNPYAAQPLYLGNDFSIVLHRFRTPALHLDNTLVGNDYPQLSCLA
jgi:hypothetical protein